MLVQSYAYSITKTSEQKLGDIWQATSLASDVAGARVGRSNPYQMKLQDNVAT